MYIGGIQRFPAFFFQNCNKGTLIFFFGFNVVEELPLPACPHRFDQWSNITIKIGKILSPDTRKNIFDTFNRAEDFTRTWVIGNMRRYNVLYYNIMSSAR